MTGTTRVLLDQFWFGGLIDCFWFYGCKNFGDLMARDIVPKLSGKLPFNNKWSGGRHVTVGSALHWVREGDMVWGSGMLFPGNLPTTNLNVHESATCRHSNWDEG